MADKYSVVRYEGLSASDWDAVEAAFNSTSASGVSVMSLEGKKADGWLQVNVGGPSAVEFTETLKGEVSKTVSSSPTKDQEVEIGESKCRTAGDIKSYGNASISVEK